MRGKFDRNTHATRSPGTDNLRPLGGYTYSTRRSSYSSSNSSLWSIIVAVLICLCVLATCGRDVYLGVGGWGPVRTQLVTVNRLYVDVSGSGDDAQSHYMVGTDRGVFEVNNGWTLGVWNADQIYSALEQSKRYCVTSHGNQVTGAFIQEYPYITSVVRADETWTTDEQCLTPQTD